MLPVPPNADLATDGNGPRTRLRFALVLAGLGWFGAYIGLQVLLVFPWAFVGIALDLKDQPWFPLTVGIMASFVASAILIYPASRPLGVRQALAFRGCRPLQLGLALLLLPALAPLIALAFALVRNAWDGGSTIPVAVASNPLDLLDDMYAGLTTLPWPLALLLGCIVPALAEEVMFRGIVGRRMVAGLGTTGGVVATSLLFGISHLDPARIAATFILGVALHCAFLATRSLLVPVTMHVAQNAMTIFGERWVRAHGFDPLGRGDNGLPVPALVLLGLIATGAVGWALYRSRTRLALADGSEWQPRLSETVPPGDAGASPRMQRPGVAPLAAAVLSCGLLVAASAGLPRGPGTPASVEDQARWHRERGDELQQNGDTVGAIAAYGEALALTPDDGLARGGRGLAHAARDDLAAAVDDLTAAVRLVPERVEYRRYLGWAHAAQGEYERALSDYAEVLRIESDDGYALNQRGHAFMRLQRYREAHDEFDRAIRVAKPTKRVWNGNEARDEVDPAAMADLRVHRGRALMRMGHFDQALDDFADALRLVPHHEEAYYELAWLRAACPEDRLRDAKAAVALARRLCDADGGRTAANLAVLAAALMENGDRLAAVRTQEEALGLATAGGREFYEHALELYRAGQPYRLSATGQ